MSSNKVPFQPIKGRVLIERKAQDEKTHGGLYIPDTAYDRPNQGTIVALSSDITADVKVGDKVLFAENSMDIEVEGKKYVLANDYGLMAVLP